MWPNCCGIIVRNRLFSQQDLVIIRRLIRRHPQWGRTRISERVCEALLWHQTNGRLKDRACRVALVRLEKLGFLRLPKRIKKTGGKPPSASVTTCELIFTPQMTMPREVRCVLVNSRPQSRLWNSLIAQFHYLGLPTPVGRILRYLVYGDERLVAAISFSECAWNLQIRDVMLDAIGIKKAERREVTVGNNRFLILPGVQIRNLASRVLAESVRVMRTDWQEKYTSSPLIVETFVDPRRFEGVCYRAANWIFVGSTKGYSKRGACHTRSQAPKLLFLKGLTPLVHRNLSQSFEESQKRAA
jgi:hypothetical protein